MAKLVSDLFSWAIWTKETGLSLSSISHRGAQRLVRHPWCPLPTKPSTWYIATVQPSRCISPCVDRRTLRQRIMGVCTIGHLSQHTHTQPLPPYGKWSHGRKTASPIHLGVKCSSPPNLSCSLQSCNHAFLTRVTAFLALLCPQLYIRYQWNVQGGLLWPPVYLQPWPESIFSPESSQKKSTVIGFLPSTALHPNLKSLV